MIHPLSSEFLMPTKKLQELSVLMVVHNSSKVSQHKIARMVNLSSSMVNNYIKKMQTDHLISVSGDTNRTKSYKVTALGRDKLISSFLSYSTEIIQFFRSVKSELSNNLNKIYKDGIRKIILFGAAETGMVVYAAIKDTPLTVVAVVDSDVKKHGEHFNGLIIQSPELLKQMETDVAVVITSFGKQEEIYNHINKFVKGAGKQKIIRLTDLYEVDQ